MARKKPAKAKTSSAQRKAARTRGAKSTKGLSARCTVRFDPARAELGGIAASLLSDISEGSRQYVADILLTEERQRVTYGASEKKAITVVFSQSGTVIWDHATRSVVRVSADEIARTRIVPAQAIEISESKNGKDATFLVKIRDETLGDVRHEITVSRKKEWAPFGPALLRVLHCGPACHAQSGLPWQRIADSGLIVSERMQVKGSRTPASELNIGSLRLVEVSSKEFDAPAGYQPLEKLLKKRGGRPWSPPTARDERSPEDIQTAAVKQGLEDASGSTRMALRINQKLTPDCLGSTRFGSVTATLHQDFLTVAANAINMVAPLIGPTTIAGGTWTVPWLANLGAVGATSPGSGLFSFLRVPRVFASPPGPAGGGTGLLDRIAFASLYERDAAGMMRTQREFAVGTLATTLTTWGVSAAASSSLMTALGDLTMVPLLSEQREITDAYEASELGVFRVTGLPTGMTSFSFGSMTLGPFTTAPLFTFSITAVAGTVNFASLGGGPLVTAATIGNAGNFVLGLSVPTITFTATISRAISPFGMFLLSVGTVTFCFLLPFLCPLVATLVTLMSFVLNNVTVVTATATGVTWTLDVRFEFDPTTERVEPFVTLLSRTGVVAVSTFGPTPNIIQNAVESLLASIANSFDAWGAMLAALGAPAIQQALRDRGLQLPVAGRQNELVAIGGSAVSSPGSVLELSADVRPFDNVASQPFTTQVITSEGMRQQLLVAHLNMRRDLNPQPTPPPPGPGPVLAVGTFAGLGLSQNALNYYVFQQWIQKRFEVTITDPQIISTFVGVAPGLFVRLPIRIHIWPAVPPRVEIAPHEIALGTRPLVLFFDDVRVCFEVPNPQGVDGMSTFIGVWELSCNFKTSATIELAWPWVFSLRVDQIRPSGSPLEPRSWEFIDPNVPAIMGTLAPVDVAKMVDLTAAMLVAPMSSVGISAPPSPRPWTRPLPSMQQEVFPTVQPALLVAQQFYLEMFARRKALYALPVIDTTMLQLVDGSGAPLLNTLLLPLAGAPGPLPTTVQAMTRAQGTALGTFILPLTGPPAGP